MAENHADWNGLKFNRPYSQWVNDVNYWDYYNQLKELAINEFEWLNLPDTCDARYLELILFEYGYALFFQDPANFGFFTLQCTIGGRYNMYRIPIERRAYSMNGYQCARNDLNSVIVWNNFLRQPTGLTIQLFAERLTRIQRAIDINVDAQKTPLFMSGTQEQQRGLQALYKQYQGGAPVIYGNKDMSQREIQIMKTDAPLVFPELMKARQTEWNRAMAFLGIDNANTEKRERLITAEVESNDDLLSMSRYARLDARKEACRLINDLFADWLEYPVDVRFRQTRGGDIDGNSKVYNRIGDGFGSTDGVDRNREIRGD